MRIIRGLVASVALVTLAASGLAACGSKPVGAVSVLADAQEKTEAATTARIHVDSRVTLDRQSLSFSVDGALELKTGDGSFTLGESLGIPGGRVKSSSRVVDGVLYMSAGLLGGTLAGDKHWIKVDLPARSGAAANQPNTYAGILQYLRGTDPDAVTRIGSDTVRGVRTTHYAATVRVDQLRKRLSQARLSSAQRRQLEQALRLYVTATFDIDVWVDGAGRVRRETTEVPFTFAGHVVNETVTAEWFDFGVALHVTAPPASDVADLSSLGTASALG